MHRSQAARRGQVRGTRRRVGPRRHLPDGELQGPAQGRAARGVRSEEAWRAWRRFENLFADGGRDRALLRDDGANLQHACELLPVDRRAGRRPADDPQPAARAQPAARRALHPDRRERCDLRPAVLRGGRGGGGVPPVRHARRPGRGRLDDHRQEDLRLARRLGRLLRRAVHREEGESEPPRHDVFRRPRRSRGGERGRRLGSARHAGNGLAQPSVRERLRAGRRGADAEGDLFRGRDPLAAHVHHADPELYGNRPGRL